MAFGIVELYLGQSGKQGFYNSQEVGLARAMKKLGHSCVIFYPKKGIHREEEVTIEDGIKIVYVPAHSIGTHSWYDWRVIKRYNVDVVQVGSDNQIFAPSFVHYCDKNKILCYHFVGTVGSDSNNSLKRRLMAFLFRRNLKVLKNHQVFAKTASVRDKLLQLGVPNVEIAHVGLDTTIIPAVEQDRKTIRKELGIAEGQTLILFVGRIDAYKRPFELIELAKHLPDTYRFLAIGSGAMNQEFENAIQPLNGRIQWIKQIPNEQIHAYYKSADYFVNFNEKEIFGMSILEAMYHGCTVIANHAPGPDEIIVDGTSGYLVSNTDHTRQLLLEKRMLNADAVHNYLLACFTWEQTANHIQDWIVEKTERAVDEKTN